MCATLAVAVALAAALRARAEPNVEDLRAWLARIDLPRAGSTAKPERAVPGPEASFGPALALERLAASVLLCSASDDLVVAKAAVREEEEAARRLGVADLTRLEEQREAASKAERSRVAALRSLSDQRLAPLGCEEPEVARLVKCVHRMDGVSPADWCDDPAWHEFQERMNWDP